MAATEFIGMIEPVARQLLGEPNPKLSTRQELRYGTNGSVSVDLDKDTWYDHEREEGGGVLKLITRETGRPDAAEWMRENGYDLPTRADASPRVEDVAYDYVDEHGELLFQVVRQPGHKFVQRKPAGSGWEYRVRGVRLVPYRLPELLMRPDETVYIAEGEKDVDNLRASGLLATCNSGGAGKWRREHSQHLAGRHVVILPDNDEPGRDHAKRVAESLQGVAASVCVVELPNLPPKGDASDWLAAGGTPEHLADLCRNVTVTARPTLQTVDLSDLMDTDPQPPAFVMAPIVPRRVATLLGGHGGAGKTMLALSWGAHVAAGKAWGPYQVDRGRVLFVSLEDDGQVCRYRLRRIIETHHLQASDVIANLHVLDGSDVEAALMVEVNDGGTVKLTETPMMEAIEAAAKGADLIIIDNASDAFAGNENVRMQVRGFIRRLAQLGRGNNAGVIILAHIDKQAARNGGKDNTYSGSTAWHNSARSRVALVEEDGRLELRHEKSNWGKRADPLQVARVDHGVVVPTVAASNTDVGKDDAAAVLALLGTAFADNVTVTCASAGPETTWHTLAKLAEFPQVYRDRLGRKRLETALMALERAGQIVRQTYQKPNRHPGQRWALAQTDLQRAA